MLLQVKEIPADIDLISLSWSLDKIRKPEIVHNCNENLRTQGCNAEIRKATGLVKAYFPGYLFGMSPSPSSRKQHAPNYSFRLWSISSRESERRTLNVLIVVFGYARFYSFPPVNCDPSHDKNKGPKFRMVRDKIQKLILLLDHRPVECGLTT